MQRALPIALLLLSFVFVVPGSAQPAATASSPGTSPQEKPRQKYQEVEIQTEDDLTLHAAFYPSSKKRELAPAALLVHDADGDNSSLAELAERLQKLGFAVLVPDLRGHGKSRLKPGENYDELSQDRRETLWAFSTRDIDASARWLSKRDDVHAASLSLVGLREGCGLAVNHAANDENVLCIALLAPEASSMGFNIASQLQDLAGLPTFIVAQKAALESTQKMVDRAHENSFGDPFIDLVLGKGNEDVLADPRLPSRVAKWVKEKAVPKKAQRGR